nr:ion channel [Enterobacter sp. RHBSTW-01064]
MLVGRLSDFIYYCSVVGSTLGFGDLSPQTAEGRFFYSSIANPSQRWIIPAH